MSSRGAQMFTNILGTHVTHYDQNAMTMLHNLQQMYIASGSDPVTAQRRAAAALFGMVQRQAAMLSFVEVFRFMGGLFILMLPLIFLFKRPKMGRSPMGGGH